MEITTIATEIFSAESKLKDSTHETTTVYMTGYVNGLKFLYHNFGKTELIENKKKEIAHAMVQIQGIFKNQLIGFMDGLNFKQ